LCIHAEVTVHVSFANCFVNGTAAKNRHRFCIINQPNLVKYIQQNLTPNFTLFMVITFVVFLSFASVILCFYFRAVLCVSCSSASSEYELGNYIYIYSLWSVINILNNDFIAIPQVYFPVYFKVIH